MTTNSANTANTAIAKEAVETNGAQSQQTDPPTLQLDNVSYAYTKGGKRVLKNISHDFQAGKVHAITGPSGAGKTTLLSLISGLANPTEGMVLVDGTDLSERDRYRFRSHDSGVIFQSFNLLPNLTVAENIILSMDASGKSFDKPKKAIVEELLKQVHLPKEYANERILHLSGGEQQRVAIGREALRADLYAGTVHRMAIDVATYDQQSCLAPQTMFVERGGAMSPAQVAELLASELDGQQRKYPRSTPSEEESMAIQRLRSTAQMKALMLGAGPMAAAAGNADDAPSDDPFVVQSRSGTDWTVLYYPSIGMADSLSTPLNRTVNIVAVDHVEDALPTLRPYAQWLQTCGVALAPDRLFDVAQRVGETGIDRICPVGEMNRAKSGWHHDGGFNLLDLVHAVDIERNTDTYCDGFDMDVE